MHDSNHEQDIDALFNQSIPRTSQAEMRLDAVCELVEQELNGGMDDQQLNWFSRRIAADVDTVMAEETHWVSRVRCGV